jgi:hypothetical protein
MDPSPLITKNPTPSKTNPIRFLPTETQNQQFLRTHNWNITSLNRTKISKARINWYNTHPIPEALL